MTSLGCGALRTNIIALVPLTAIMACAPAVRLQVLQPAEVALPTHVRSLALVDRSRAKNVGQQVLGTLEGVLTGEGVGLDRAGAQGAIGGLVDVLVASPRFEVLVPELSKEQVESGLSDTALSDQAIANICRSSGAQAIVALEAFDSDSSMTEWTEFEESSTGSEKVFYAERQVRVLSAFRVYDGTNQVVLDDARDRWVSDAWQADGGTKRAARRHLPALHELVGMLAEESGQAYGRRIAPHYVMVQRRYFGGGTPEMVLAKKMARDGDWQAAQVIWAELVAHPDQQIVAKSHFNLAVAAEEGGRLDEAMKHAQLADRVLRRRKTRRYLSVLQTRRRDALRVQEQMAHEQADHDTGTGRPLAVPAGEAEH